MSMPFYVAPEQVMKDRSDYARRQIASRGRPLAGLVHADGILFVTENSYRSLHKISEIYDRIAFAAVGKYNEFEQLRVAGVRHADMKGYIYSREDVDARSLANAYAQQIGQTFTHEMKPLEVEILVAEVGDGAIPDQLYHVGYDGAVAPEEHFSVLGGDADLIASRLQDAWQPAWPLTDALRGAVEALAGPDRTLGASALEVAVLARGNGRRAFRRIEGAELDTMLTAPAPS